ncbi:DnaD domain-containing protein [Tuanshanicoccus lijuaniae]|uniref:DnaD domain-containing protein n=1 Tax=Aerococcaceae bacterium zg-1292 TaxID=2774330 RepID=UPI001BD8061E|nr:DnaD domain protein [Aerococcaceae bacterium zg-BR22]MBS4456003.1 DnaD domain protein [Aerococcaceae bacterium zg-A91]MBS4457755.1 DnaD domain protein [Aerococcaceae bacterium zg-BR33]
MTLMYQVFSDGVTIIPRKMIQSYKDLKISPQAFILLIYLIDHQRELQHEAPLKKVAVQLGWDEKEVYEYFSELLMAEYIRFDMETDEQGKKYDVLSLEPFYEMLEQKMKPQKTEPTASKASLEQKLELVPTFEGEFGRPLTQIELMQIADWKTGDAFEDDLIILALKQAVLNQAISLKYIDRILLGWKKKNIRTVEEAKRDIEQYNQAKVNRQQQSSSQSNETIESFKIPDFNWDELK